MFEYEFMEVYLEGKGGVLWWFVRFFFICVRLVDLEIYFILICIGF